MLLKDVSPPLSRKSLQEQELNLPSSLRRVNQEERRAERRAVSPFISSLRAVDVTAIAPVLPLALSHAINFGSTSPVQLV